MPTSRTCLGFLLGALLAMGCAPASSDHASASESELGEEVSAAGLQEGSDEAEGVLLLVNDSAMTADLFDKRAGLPHVVAERIIAYRTDEAGHARWFQTLAEIDAIEETTANTFKALVADAHANGYVDEGPFDPPTRSQIVIPEYLTGPLSIDDVHIDAGFDGMTPDDVVRLVRARVPTNILQSKEEFLRTTILATHKSFTLAIGNLFVPNAPFGSWLRGLQADKITLLGTASQLHPTVLVTEKDGVISNWVRNAQGYEPMDPAAHYPILMRAHIRLETDPEGQGVRVYYPACPLKALQDDGFIVEEPSDP